MAIGGIWWNGSGVLGAHPIVLVTSAITAQLWWDGLECGVEDILGGPYRLLACANSWELSRKIID